ncbi:MAG: DUF6600 domain-containing protein [Candidatus Cybelea sp.]|jgi:hypothetical protein
MTFKWFTSFITGIALIGATLTSTLPASAEQAPDNNGPGVARVSVVQGSAVVQRGDSNTQTTAVINAPLLPGDYVSTGGTSRAELQFDGQTAVRLGGNVQARITDNDPNNRAIQVADGTVEVGIVHGDQPFQVDTPSVSVRSQDAGDYRVTVDRDGSTWATARRGTAQVITPQRTYDLSPGRTLVARGSASSPSISWRSEVGFDSFDDFNAKRDETMMTALNASPNLSPTIAGYDNLDQYGDWQDVAGYGQVWVPDEPADWAPYRDGSWAWEGGYGWTWVGTEPWGWAPYHYGRWFWANGYGWAWYPPAYSYAPVWAPALVGFYGWGGGVGIGVGFGYGGIGWCPLAPFEAFYPWYSGWAWGGWGWGYGGYGGYGTRVVNVTNIHNVYRNFGHGGGSGTLRGNFEHGNFSHNVAVTSQNAGKVGTIRGALPVTPSRDNLGFGRTPSRTVAFSKSFDSPRFASNRALTSHNSFAEQQKSIAGAIHANTTRESAPVSHESGTAQARTTGARASETRATEPRTTESRTTEAGATEREPNQSWERFDESRGSSRESSASERSAQSERASSASEGSREERPASNSWSRDSNQRGSASVPVTYGDRDRGAYTHSSYPSYSHSSYPSYSHSSYPSYSHSSYPSYSHSSYPSYSHSSYPSYSHSSYPSYSRGSAPSAPSYPHGSGGGSAPHSSGGGGGGHGGGGRPPH